MEFFECFVGCISYVELYLVIVFADDRVPGCRSISFFITCPLIEFSHAEVMKSLVDLVRLDSSIVC